MADQKPAVKKAKRPPLTPEQQAARQRVKRAKFVELVVPRVNKALARIRQVRNLASRATYDYTPEQAGRVLAALSEAVHETELAFAGRTVTSAEWSL
jgi:hypothetical protein